MPVPYAVWMALILAFLLGAIAFFLRRRIVRWFLCRGLQCASLIMLLVLGVGGFLVVSHRSGAPLMTTAYIARRDLASYALLSNDDVRKESLMILPGESIPDHNPVGKVAIRPIQGGSVVVRSSLFDPHQRRLWVLSVDRTSLPSPSVGQIIALIGIDTSKHTSRVVADQARALGSDGKQIVVAVTLQDAANAETYTHGKDRTLVAVSCSEHDGCEQVKR